MANWYYYDKRGDKIGPVTASELKALALQGEILPERMIENEAGKTVLATKVKGLVFPDTPPAPTEPIGASVPTTLQEKTDSPLLAGIDVNNSNCKNPGFFGTALA